MSSSQIIQNILNLTLLAGMVFGIYIYFRRPQENSYTTDKLMSQRIETLAQDFANLRDNHVHTLDVKMDGMRDELGNVKIEVAKLSTIIDERIPKK